MALCNQKVRVTINGVLATMMSQIPTRVRHGVLLFLCLLSFILYLDRVCVGQATVPIQNELKLTDSQMGWVHAAFTIAYGIFEVPTGHWGDRYGSRGVLVRIVLWWSAFTALTGAATGLWMMLAVRFLFGAGEAGALPNSARVISRWFPPGGRGPAQGMVTMSTLAGAVLAPLAAQAIINQAGWRWTFVVFGSVGVVWALAFHIWFRDDPAAHPSVNRGELELIAPGTPSMVRVEAHPPVPWRSILGSPSVWLLGFVTSCAAFASYLNYSWYPKYLQAARRVSANEASGLTSFVLSGGALGCLLGGYLGDWVVRRSGSRRWSRRLLGAGGLAIAAAALSTSVHLDTPFLAAVCAAIAALTAGVTLTAWWAVVTEISGKHLGVVFALTNSMGVIGAAGSQLFFGRMSDFFANLGREGRERYDPAFYVYSVVLLFGAIGWLFIDATRSVVTSPLEVHPWPRVGLAPDLAEKPSQHIRSDLRNAFIDKDGAGPADGAG
jgi:MFS family permease